MVETAGSRAPRLELLKALGDNTRYAIYLELARASAPLATAQIAEHLDLHPNTVRPHLERMREVGLLEVVTDARGAVGRPQHRYSLAPDAPALGFEPPAFPVLARMLLRLAATAGLPAGDAIDAGREQGERGRRPVRPVAPVRGGPRPPSWPSSASTRESAADEQGATHRRSPAARSGSWPRPTRSSSAACTVAWSRASWPPGATARSRVSTTWPTASPARSRSRAHPGSLSAQSQLGAPRRTSAVITLTDTAATKVKDLIAAEGDPALALRVAVRPGGCSGFSYEMFFDTDVAADDRLTDEAGVRVVVDEASAELLQGATLDYKDGLQGAGFAIENPNAQRSCGCGKSFS